MKKLSKRERIRLAQQQQESEAILSWIFIGIIVFTAIGSTIWFIFIN